MQCYWFCVDLRLERCVGSVPASVGVSVPSPVAAEDDAATLTLVIQVDSEPALRGSDEPTPGRARTNGR